MRGQLALMAMESTTGNSGWIISGNGVGYLLRSGGSWSMGITGRQTTEDVG